MNRKTLIGYVSSKPFWYGVHIPQRIQNIVIRDYCNQLDYNLAWSNPEVSHGDQLFAFKSLIKLSIENNISGLCLISLRMHNYTNLSNIICMCFENSIEVHFAFENIAITEMDDRELELEKIKRIYYLDKGMKSTMI